MVAGVLVLVMAACAGESGEPAPGPPPKVTATFQLGSGRMPDVATDSSTHRAYVTSSGDDSLYVVDAKARIGAIKVGKAPGFVAVDPTTQSAYVTIGN